MAKFTDAHLVDIAVRLIEHARNTTAIKDCRCHECSGFLEESAQWLEIVRSRSATETSDE